MEIVQCEKFFLFVEICSKLLGGISNLVLRNGEYIKVETKVMDNDEIEIDLREIFFCLLHRFWIILLVAILCGGVGFCISQFLIAPTYESTTQIYILNKQNENTVTYSDVQLGTQLTKDYAELIKSRYVLESVIEELQLLQNGEAVSYETILNKVSVSTPQDTRMLAITVTDTDPMLAMEIANCVREVAAEHIKSVMDIEAVNVVDEANLPTHKANPSVFKWTLLGMLLGAFLVMAIVVIIYILDDTIKTSDDVEKYLGLSTLALIPLNASDRK